MGWCVGLFCLTPALGDGEAVMIWRLRRDGMVLSLHASYTPTTPHCTPHRTLPAMHTLHTCTAPAACTLPLSDLLSVTCLGGDICDEPLSHRLSISSVFCAHCLTCLHAHTHTPRRLIALHTHLHTATLPALLPRTCHTATSFLHTAPPHYFCTHHSG